MDKMVTSLDFFTGGVPASAIFSMNIREIRAILNSRKRSHKYSNAKYELCLIGLVAYFEAFFKDHFASLINIYPNLLFSLKEKNYDVNIDICDLVEFGITSNHFYGFIVAEKYDFGSPSKINSMYQSLIKISPFTNDEKVEYEKILNDRNLLVHHGGIYTTKYSQQKMKRMQFTERVFFDSIVFSKNDIISAIDFCESIVLKVSKSSQIRIREIIKEHKFRTNKLIKGAIKFLDMP